MTSSIPKTAAVAALAASLVLPPLAAQEGGDPDFDPRVDIQYGRVIKAEKVKIGGDGRVAALGVFGGMAGLAYGRHKGKSTRSRNKRVLGGAALGAAIGKKSGGGSREINQYTVRLLNGQLRRISTEQDDFREADCVVLERVDEMSNIRRVPDRAGEPASQPVVLQLRPEDEDEAEEG
ncbi:MAG: hypothetical protein O7A04_07235, partial [Acidobacteria bacterium]|nr:hypothetical protein [Acidobacteriota bacterium]